MQNISNHLLCVSTMIINMLFWKGPEKSFPGLTWKFLWIIQLVCLTFSADLLYFRVKAWRPHTFASQGFWLHNALESWLNLLQHCFPHFWWHNDASAPYKTQPHSVDSSCLTGEIILGCCLVRSKQALVWFHRWYGWFRVMWTLIRTLHYDRGFYVFESFQLFSEHFWMFL